jgi:formylglycine-generating enzyme required for sulfatase activity
LKNDWDIRKTLGQAPFPETIVSPIDGAEMVLVPEGDFTMGITQEDLYKILLLDERENPVFATEMPAKTVNLKSYYIDRYPVTNYQYRKFIEQTGHREPMLLKHTEWGRPMQPVVFVGWDDARAYAGWAGKTLPPEEHWEKAGRGTDARWYSWGDEFLPNYCNSREFKLGHTSDIGLFDSGMSPYGCYDMCGNVWEMCEGRWLEDSLPMRGGCFLGSSSFVRVTCRWTPEDPVDGAHWLGFRCMKEIPTPM